MTGELFVSKADGSGTAPITDTAMEEESAPDWQPIPVRCGGRPATIVGTPAADRLIGTASADVIAGLGGADTLKGLRGRDVLCGGAGRDRLRSC